MQLVKSVIKCEGLTKTLKQLAKSNPQKYKKVLKSVSYLEGGVRTSGQNSHEYDGFSGPNGERVWAVYVENHCPSAWRLLYCYGNDGCLYILDAIPHPKYG